MGVNHRGRLVLLPPNRVWRHYPGGRTLDRLARVTEPGDSHLAEDWIGSVTETRFTGREHLREGVAKVRVGERTYDWRELLGRDPEYFLGRAHVERFGAEPMILVKFLDSAIRLSFQAHPSREFARKFLQADSGKTEAYLILAVRPEMDSAYIYVGFQRPPTPAGLRRMIEEQDMAALERCFDRIPVRPGDAFVIPAGFPHALGEGLFLIEIQEPTDFVVRYEFESAGYVIPEGARFMGRGIDFALALTDFGLHSREEIERDYRCRPRRIREFGPDSWQEELIGPAQTLCFGARITHLGGPIVRSGDGFYIGIVTAGCLTAQAGGEVHSLKTYDRFIVPDGLDKLTLTSQGGAEIVECVPPVSLPV